MCSMHSYFSSSLSTFPLSFSFYCRLMSLQSIWTTAIMVYNTVLRGIAVGAIRAMGRDNTDFISANELTSRYSTRPFVWLKVIKVFGPHPAFLHTYVHARIRHTDKCSLRINRHSPESPEYPRILGNLTAAFATASRDPRWQITTITPHRRSDTIEKKVDSYNSDI